MMPPHLRPHLCAAQQELRCAFGARLRDVRLFGSHARGEATEDSDVDVLVLVDELTPAEVATISDIATRGALRTGITPAPLPLSTAGFADMMRPDVRSPRRSSATEPACTPSSM